MCEFKEWVDNIFSSVFKNQIAELGTNMWAIEKQLD